LDFREGFIVTVSPCRQFVFRCHVRKLHL
jgi:hypothetical protein